MNLEEVFVTWFDDYGKAKKSASEDTRKWAVYIRPTFGRLSVSEVGYLQVRNWHKALTKQRGPVMANRALALLSTVCRYAVRALRVAAVDPTDGVRANTEQGRRRYLSTDEMRLLIEAIEAASTKDPKGAAFIQVALLTGARKAELESCTWGEVKGDHIELTRHKTDQDGHSRVIILSAAAQQALNNIRNTSEKALVFGRFPRSLWDSVRETANLQDVHLHDLRHNLASILISHHGATLAQVGDLLGHSSAATTKRYSHLIRETASNLSEAASKTMLVGQAL